MNDSSLNEAGVSPKQIFEIMKINIFDNFYNYSFSSINKEYLCSRKTLFNLLHKITKKIGFKSQTFFLCTLYLDMILSSSLSEYFRLLIIAYYSDTVDISTPKKFHFHFSKTQRI